MRFDAFVVNNQRRWHSCRGRRALSVCWWSGCCWPHIWYATTALENKIHIFLVILLWRIKKKTTQLHLIYIGYIGQWLPYQQLFARSRPFDHFRFNVTADRTKLNFNLNITVKALPVRKHSVNRIFGIAGCIHSIDIFGWSLWNFINRCWPVVISCRSRIGHILMLTTVLRDGTSLFGWTLWL